MKDKCLFTIMVIFVFAVVPTLSGITGITQLLNEFVTKSTRYISRLYTELFVMEHKNFMVCPLSIQIIFAFLSVGARERTAKQIMNTLRLPENKEEFKDIFSYLSKALRFSDNIHNFKNANKLYVNNTFKINDQYKKAVAGIFSTEIESIDFSKEIDAVDVINAWIEHQTSNKIIQPASDDIVNDKTLAVIVDAFYFQEPWMIQFNTIIRMPFKLNKEQAVFTNMLTVTEIFKYQENDILRSRLIQLPYKTGEITMTIILPNDIEGLIGLERRIVEVLRESRIQAKYRSAIVDLTIPRFNMETTTDFLPILKRLGIVDAFSSFADFNGICERQNLSIDEVVQKTFIEVNKYGTQAAVAFDMEHYNEYMTTVLVVDHPFLFFLEHKLNGIYFIGRFSVPEQFSRSQ